MEGESRSDGAARKGVGGKLGSVESKRNCTADLWLGKNAVLRIDAEIYKIGKLNIVAYFCKLGVFSAIKIITVKVNFIQLEKAAERFGCGNINETDFCIFRIVSAQTGLIILKVFAFAVGDKGIASAADGNF